MQSPVCFIGETEAEARNRPIKIVNHGTCESPRSELAIPDSIECTDERSQSSVNSTGIADKKFGPFWGETGEVSPPRSRSSAEIPLGQRLGEISPLCDRSSDGGASMETANLTVSSRSPRPSVSESGEDLTELRRSSCIPPSATCRPFSKEQASLPQANNLAEEHLTCAQQMKEKVLMQGHSQNMAIIEYSTPRAKFEHVHELVPEMDLAQWNTSSTHEANFSDSGSPAHSQKSNAPLKAQLCSVSVLLEEPLEGEKSPINSNGSEAMDETKVAVPGGSPHPVPGLLYPAGFAKQDYEPGSQAAINNEKMENILCSWEVFLNKVKSYGQVPTDFVKSLEASLQQTKGEIQFDTNRLALNCNGRTGTEGDDEEHLTSPELIADPGKRVWKSNLVKIESSVPLIQENCHINQDIVCHNEEGTSSHEEEKRAKCEERRIHSRSNWDQASVVKAVYDYEKRLEKVRKRREARGRPLRQSLQTVDVNNHEISYHSSVDVSEKTVAAVNVSDKHNIDNISMSRQNWNLDSSRTETQILDSDICCTLPVLGGENTPCKGIRRRINGSKSPSKEVLPGGNHDLMDIFPLREENELEIVEQFSNLESTSPVNPNKRNANISTFMSYPDKPLQARRKSNTPNPGTVSPNLQAGLTDEQNYLKNVCEKGDIHFSEINSQKKNIPKLSASFQSQDMGISHTFANEAVEATVRAPWSYPQFQRSHRCFSPDNSAEAKRGPINSMANKNIWASQTNRICRNVDDIIINPNRNEYLTPDNLEASPWKEQSSYKLKDNLNRFVASKHSFGSSVKTSSKASRKKKWESSSRVRDSPGRREKRKVNKISSANFDLPKITPQCDSDVMLINRNIPPSYPLDISSKRKEQIGKDQRHSPLQKHQAAYGKQSPYLETDPQRHQPLPYQHQLVLPNYAFQHRAFDPYYTLLPGVYENTTGYTQMIHGHPQVYPQPLYPVNPFPCPCYTPSLHYH